MKRILCVSIIAGSLFFSVGLYLAHAEEVKKQTPQEVPSLPPGPNHAYVVPRVASNSGLIRPRDTSGTCSHYLDICKFSCVDRGGLFRFSCYGQNFQPFSSRYQCLCADSIGNLLQIKAEK